ncbi:MAG: hypothetical protein AB1752_08955 [Candidatus Zixiibacteriota bacterium]
MDVDGPGRRNLKALRTTILLLGLVGALLAARFQGGSIGTHRAESTRQAALNQFLHKNLKGVAVGQEFPAVPVWTPAGDSATTIPELLPGGGLVFYVMSDCHACTTAVRILAEERARLGNTGIPAVNVSSSNPADLLASLPDDFPIHVWIDQQDLLLSEYGVRTTRTYFKLDRAGRAISMGTLEFDPTDYRAILRRE